MTTDENILEEMLSKFSAALLLYTVEQFEYVGASPNFGGIFYCRESHQSNKSGTGQYSHTNVRGGCEKQ